MRVNPYLIKKGGEDYIEQDHGTIKPTDPGSKIGGEDGFIREEGHRQ